MLAPMLRALRTLALSVPLCIAVSGCAGIGQPAPYDSAGINGLVVPTPSPDPADFVEVVDNPWLALEPGATWTYDVVDSGRTIGRIDAEVIEAGEQVAGLDVTAVRTTTEIDGASVSSNRFYAQDVAGNVWLVGVDSGTGAQSWRAGEAGNQAGLAMPADPRLGDGWLMYEVPGLPRARTTIEEQTPELLQTRDEAATTTRSVYEKGVGLVGIAELDDGWTAELRD